MNKISRVCICVICFFILTTSISNAQDKIRTVEHGKFRTYDIKSEPIAIVSRELGDRPFMNDRQVKGGPDWLRDLTLGVKNISNKTIKSFEIDIIIEKQANMSTNSGLLLRFPLPPNPVLNTDGNPTGNYELLKVLKPGEVVKIKAADSQLRMLDAIKKDGVGDIDRVSLSIQLVVFDDGTRWYQGIETREDPNSPGTYIVVGPESPEPTLSQLFSRWLSSFAFINEVSQPLDQFAFILPAKSRFFFANDNTKLTPPSPPIDGCGWFNPTSPFPLF